MACYAATILIGGCHRDQSVLADEGFATFYRQEYLRVVLFLRKYGASGAEAEDAAQEAMTQACGRWDKIESPRAWVRKAALSCYLRQKKKVSREVRVSEPEALMADRASHTDESNHEGQLRVIVLMRQLPLQQRTVAALFYDGLSLSEIAEVTAKPVDTIRSLLRYARNRLEEVIQSEGVDSADASS
jgi:RNA polymerase sigma factor (sigma-70 family)